MIQVVIQDEHGKPLCDQVDLPGNILPLPEDERFACARFIDPYGDAVFNVLQMPYLHRDLSALKMNTEDLTAKEAIERVLRLIEQYQDEAHVYIKFIGD